MDKPGHGEKRRRRGYVAIDGADWRYGRCNSGGANGRWRWQFRLFQLCIAGIPELVNRLEAVTWNDGAGTCATGGVWLLPTGCRSSNVREEVGHDLTSR